MSPMPGYDQLVARLRDMRRRAIAFEWGAHLGLVVALLAGAFVALTIVMALAVPSVVVRVAIVSILGLAVVGVLALAVVKSTLMAPRYSSLALAVEKQHPELKNRLIASLQLADRARANPEHYSLELVDLTIRQATQLSDTYDFARALDRARLVRSARWAGIGLGAALVLSLLFPGLASRSWEAYSNPLTDYAAPIPYELSVEPGSVEAVKFDDFQISAHVTGAELPRTATVHVRMAGGDWRLVGPISPVPTAVKAAAPGTAETREFRATLPQIKHDFEYYVAAGERTSETYTVAAVDRPRVSSLRLELFPPKYTGLPTQVIDENDGAINAPVGTTVKMRLESNRRLARASLAYSDGPEHTMEVRSQGATAEFTVEKNRSYHIVLVDESGRTNPHPIEYPITAIADRDPSVEIALPGHNADLDDNMAVDLKVVARDDYGFSKLTLHTRWMSEGRERAVREFEIPGVPALGERLEAAYFWDLAVWGLLPEDVIHYYVEVADNDRVAGPKTAQSRTYTVRLPSLDEMIAEYEDERDADIDALDKILQGEFELSERIKDLQRELAHDPKIDWNRQQELENLSARGEQLEKELGEIAESMQEQVQKAQANKLQSMELIQKMMEAQQLFNEVATEEMKEAMRQLQEAMKNLDPEEVQRALAQMDLSQEELLERLDRTLAYLKKLQAEQKVDAMVRRLEEMVNQQNAINDETAKTPESGLPDIAPSEERLKESFDELASDMEKAESLLTEPQIAEPNAVNQFCQSAKKSAAPQHMKQTAQNMSNKDKSGSESEGQKSSEALQALLDEMKEFQNQMSSRQQEQMAAELREALDKALYLSEEQEGLLDQTQQMDPNSLSLRDYAAEQEALRAATERLAGEIGEMAKQSTCMGGGIGQGLSRSVDRMQQSAQSLSDRRGASARSMQREALFELNNAAQEIVKSMEKNSGQCNNPSQGMCENPGKAGAMGKMSALSQQQGRLNQQMPGNDGQSQAGMSQSERDQLSRLKAEQQAIQQGVEQMHSEVGDQRDLLGRLDKLAEEMKRVVEDMDKGNVTQETRDRQRRIYSRMLDFQHSLQKQDYKDERKAQFGQDVMRSSPAELDNAHGLTDEEYDRLLTRYQEEGYPKEYEETIKAYFRALVESRGTR
ncbi:MAG: DUF4175 family protein [Candidatus Zixiibacteriota bacterium]